MRITLKGGVWKNTEDEILKAAVMKYGKNQWARISSLLNRKSPKQCKARWYEWLDPSIKKTEWSKEEDEKLLHLAKLMPTQWRTIAPIVGRTPTQCLERYQKLLDEAEQQEAGGEMADVGAVTAEDIRRLRPGEIDPDPETKPARPDPIDMDEDEKEMLSEARARLANTQGKKAKRKARERQLEESRRLASLQKRRELKAAGVNWKLRVRKGEINYNTEVPFQIRAPAGFFDTSEEKQQLGEAVFKPVKLSDIEPKTRAQQEDENQRNDMRKRRQMQEKGIVPDVNAQLQKLEPSIKRRKMVLPAPQLTENELEEIVKIGQTQDSLFHTVDSSEDSVTSSLITAPDASRPFTDHIRGRTPATFRTPAPSDAIRAEAANLLALQNTATPLLGGSNRDLVDGGTGFGGITPARVSSATPQLAPEKTPMRAQAIGQTPIRSELFDLPPVANDEGEISSMQDSLKSRLKEGLLSLPKPKNEFEIVVPDEVEEDENEINMDGFVEDQAEIEERENRERAAEMERELKRRTQAIQRDLPRPIQFISYDYDHSCSIERKLVFEEMNILLRHDFVSDPPANAILGSTGKYVFEKLPDRYVEQARTILNDECTSGNQEIFDDSDPSDPDCNQNYEVIEKSLLNQRNRISKQMAKQSKLLGGYVQRSQTLKEKLNDSVSKLSKATLDLQTFGALYEEEHRRAAMRVSKLSEEVERMKNIESEAQHKYQNLLEAKQMGTSV